MATAQQTRNQEAEIRALVDEWVNALRVKNIDAMMRHYGPDFTCFDVKPPLQIKEAEAYRKMWEDCLPCFDGLIGYELHDLKITAGEDVAFCHSVNRMSVKSTSGNQRELWLRATVGFRKINGQWTVVHEHASVPFDPTTQQACLDLQP